MITRLDDLRGRPDQHVGVQMVAMPCSGVASTRIDTSPMRKSIGWMRGVFDRLKKGQDIRSCASRGAMRPGKARNKSSC